MPPTPERFFLTIAATGFGVAFLHAALPTHWLPFALTAKARRWSRGKTLGITAAAASAHVLATICIGWFLYLGGKELSEEAHEFFHLIAAGLMLLLGAWFVIRQVRGKGHGHFHLLGRHGEEVHDHDYDQHCIDRELDERKANRLTIGSLIMMLTFSPCESFLPIYISGAVFGWTGFLYLSIVLFVATVGAMVLFTELARLGVERLRLGLLEQYENGLLGGLLIILGFVLLLWGH